MIDRLEPIVLDGRTPQEFKEGRTANAAPMLVQERQKPVGELNGHEDRDILICCATGNRSTVAAKILIDRGFKRIYNLRGGIVDRYRKGFPIRQ